MITRREVFDAVCEEFGLTSDELAQVGRKGTVGRARVAAYSLMHEAGWSWAEVGAFMGTAAPWRPISLRSGSTPIEVSHPLEMKSLRMRLGFT